MKVFALIVALLVPTATFAVNITNISVAASVQATNHVLGIVDRTAGGTSLIPISKITEQVWRVPGPIIVTNTGPSWPYTSMVLSNGLDQDFHFMRIVPGLTYQNRGYFRWDYPYDTEKWVMGVNSNNQFICYWNGDVGAASGAGHVLYGGGTNLYINAHGSGQVIINSNSSGDTTSGTGGFAVNSGGSSYTNEFTVIPTSGVFTYEPFRPQNGTFQPIKYGGSTTLQKTDYFYVCNVASATVTLRSAQYIAGQIFWVKSMGPSTSVSIASTSSQLFDGQSGPYSGITASNQCAGFISDGTNWVVIKAN